MSTQGIFGVISSARKARTGNLGEPVKIFNQTLAQSGSVAVQLNRGGFAGWVLVSKAKIVSGGVNCAINAIRWNGKLYSQLSPQRVQLAFTNRSY